jgi:hypothetical protein
MGNQILMIANELNRAGHWMERGDVENVCQCYERAFELTDLTLDDPKWAGKTKELFRFRELTTELYVQNAADQDANRLLYRVLIQLCPESANAVLT